MRGLHHIEADLGTGEENDWLTEMLDWNDFARWIAVWS